MPYCYTKSGRVTPFGFSLGMTESYIKDAFNCKFFIMRECVYSVRGFKDGKHFCEVFKRIAKARRFYDKVL